RVAEALRVAERLGGQAVTIPADNIADGIVAYAKANNFTHIVTATSQRAWWQEWLRPSATHEIIRRASDISVHVVPEQLTRALKGAAAALKPAEPGTEPALDMRSYAGSLGVVIAALALGLVLQGFGITNVALVFLTAVLYNFFSLPPLYTFTIADRENVVALFFFVVVAMIASNLASRVRAQALASRERAATTENLYVFSRKLAGVFTLDDLLWAAAFQFAQMLHTRVVILLPEGESVAVRAGYPPEDTLDEADVAAAIWVWQHGSPAGRGADTLPGAKRL